MKLKGVNFFEQNADKFVLGLTGLAFVGALGLQFVPNANAIKVGSASVSPGSAYRPVEEEARKLEAQLNAKLTEEQIAAKFPNLPVAPQVALATAAGTTSPGVPFGPPPAVAVARGGGAPVKGLYALPAVPAPSAVHATGYVAAVHPIERILNKDLGAMLPPEQPFDVTAVSVEASFDGTALRAALAADPDGAGPIEAIPTSWWQDSADQESIALVALEVERELISNPDGTTPAKPEVTTLAGLPGRRQGVAEWTQNVKSLGDVDSMVRTLQSQADEVLRPAFYRTISGAPWVPPAEAAAKGDQTERARQVRRLRDRLTRIDADVVRAQQQLAKAPAANDPGRQAQPGESGRPPRESRNPTPGNASPGGGGKGGGGGPGGPSGPAPSQGVSEAKGNRTIIEGRIKQLQRERDRVVADLGKLGENVEGATPTAAAPGEVRPAAGSMLAGTDISAWTHDLTGVPGATYRYRARFVINNPLYGRNLQDAQKDLAANSLLRGAWSEWSQPQTVDRREIMFVSSADDRGELSPRPRAGVEMFKLYDGYYRRATTSLEPGDSVFGKANLPDIKLADLAKLETAVKSGDPTLGALPPGSPAAPPSPAGPGRSAPGKRAPREERPNDAGPPGAPAVPGSEIPWLSVAAPKMLPIMTDIVFIDVAPVPGDAQARPRAIFRDSTGVLLSRSPEADRVNPLYRRVSESARQGATTEAKPADANAIPGAPVPPPAPRRSTPEPGGGGGGGGG